MSYFVKNSLVLVCLVTLTACTSFSLPNANPFSGEQEGELIRQSGEKRQLETVEPENTETNEEQIDPDFLLEGQYFNSVKQVDGNQVIENPTNILAMVNKEFTLPEDYEPNDLVIPNVEFSFGDADIPQAYLRKEAANALEELFQLAKKDGIELIAVSGYRSYSRQKGIFDAEKKAKGEEAALHAVALPGQSEHQSGLAMDITSKSVNLEITEEFANTAEGKWVDANAHKAGFIIRYPKGKENITGYQFEPWHLRYIGKEKASVIYKNKLTLEEYFNKVKKI
ncbi:M15 family metallopeptidase [Metabacillus niabensis]|uniref:D-alanyl-D-alanine carboxypeptidase n=1 Tax=Metabacillus niabensis TaxID=324854 RepID=A0ABT9YZ26_9BACI|nr:M15 family metallopeptidase [Metabacillus niabensis]MDQ0225239.1 D-alanyl-D-alanine carboxypeptidase [Metabacillus niabensis]